MRFPRSSLVFALVASAAVTSLGTVAAQAAEPTPSEISVARRLFDEGKAVEDAGRWREAAEKFRSAAAIKDTPGIRFHLARCEEELGALVEALLEYDRARELIEGGVKAADVEKLLPEARERVRAKVAQVTLRPPQGVQDVSVTVDSKAISGAVINVPLPINPGRHRVQATAPGRLAFDKELQLRAGEKRELVLELAPAPASVSASPVVPAAQPAPSASPPRRVDVDTSVPTRTVVLVGEGTLLVAALGTGIYFSIAKSSADSDMEKANTQIVGNLEVDDSEGTACSMPTKDEIIEGCSKLEKARTDRRHAATGQIASFIGAGVSAAALGLTWWLWPSESTHVVPSVAVTPGRMDFGLSGRF